MARVSPAQGIRYGIGLLGYTLIVSIFGFLIFVIGIALMTRNAYIFGIILFLIGGVVTYAGFAGTLYKVIADAVAKGNEMSGSPTAEKVTADTGLNTGDADTPPTATKVDDSD